MSKLIVDTTADLRLKTLCVDFSCTAKFSESKSLNLKLPFRVCAKVSSSVVAKSVEICTYLKFGPRLNSTLTYYELDNTCPNWLKHC